MTRRRYLGLAIWLVLLTACTAAAPAASPGPATQPRSAATSVVATPVAPTFVVPSPAPETAPPVALADARFSNPQLQSEVQGLFELVYQARSLRPGGGFDVEKLRGLVEGAYADYTLPLFDREVRDSEAGLLQQVSFRDVTARLAGSYSLPGGSTGANVQVTRTREETRRGAPPTSETATYTFRAERKRLGADGVSWAIFDFLNPSTQVWISEEVVQSDAQVASELKPFFDQFYAARSLMPGKPLDLDATARLVVGSYAAYTMPLLRQTKDEELSGALQQIRYDNLSVRLEIWDSKATGHGGLATAAVTRTAYVTRASGAEAPQVATYEFRVHRHVDEVGKPNWLVADFFRPDVNRWVTALAGATVVVPPAGHG